MQVDWGCEHHFKTKIDQAFGVLDGDIAAYAVNAPVSDLKTLIVDVWEPAAKLRRTHNAAGPEETFLAWMPGPKESYTPISLKKSSFPCAIKQCHSWTFNIRGRSKNSMRGRKPLDNRFTNLVVHCNMTSMAVADPDHICIPEATTDAVDESDADDEVEEGRDALEVGVAISVHNGWKVSYRLQQPEKETYAKQRMRLRTKVRGFGGRLVFDACRKRSLATRLGICAESRQKKSEKARRITRNVRESKRIRKA